MSKEIDVNALLDALESQYLETIRKAYRATAIASLQAASDTGAASSMEGEHDGSTC